jgi:hypothetical protein
MAGMCSEDNPATLMLALEPESAALQCREEMKGTFPKGLVFMTVVCVPINQLQQSYSHSVTCTDHCSLCITIASLHSFVCIFKLFVLIGLWWWDHRYHSAQSAR